MAFNRTAYRSLLGLCMLLPVAPAAAGELPPWLPRYDLDIHLDIDQHQVRVHERVTWTNRHPCPTDRLVFNVHSHYKVPDKDVGVLAKTVELLRMLPSEAIDWEGHACEIQRVRLGDADLPFSYQQENDTALEILLPRPVTSGEAITVDLDFTFRLPQKQGRWGQWMGVTFLVQWLPVLAVFDEKGWQPTPFVPWHQPFFNEAGIYTARVTLPGDQEVACSGSIQEVRDLGDGWKEVKILAPGFRDFALLCSSRYQEFVDHAGPVRVRVLAFPEDEHYARFMLRVACEAITGFSAWIGPYPYSEFTVVESYFGWNGNECGGVVMIDQRIFNMPHLAEGFVEQLLTHETCHQWFYNLIGTHGYCETWMDEAPATYFSHRLLDEKHGKNSPFLRYPKGLGWMPNIHRDTYRFAGLCGTLGRGEGCPAVQDLPSFGHVVTLFSMAYDKGSKIFGLIEDRLGATSFLDFIRILYAKYQYRILRVADLRCELEAYTGYSWEEFFRFWLYGPGITDWSVDKVKLTPLGNGSGKSGMAGRSASFLDALKAAQTCSRPYMAVVILHHKGECCEPTVLGFCLDGGDGFQVRVPIDPRASRIELDDPPAVVETMADNHVRVEIVLPCKPTQIAVDPDQVLVDSEPSNNCWKTRVRWHLTPLYTPLEETDYTNAYDRWNILAGPWLYGPAYNDPWYTRSAMAGFRVGAYRTQQLSGGVYLGYRTDYRDIAAGVDLLKDHWPWPHTQIGFNAERSISQYSTHQATADRGVLFGRYIFQYGSSLYLPPIHYVELFGAIQNHYLPWSANVVPGSERADHQTAVGLHYHLNYMTPYWDAEGGYSVDATYADGLPVLGATEEFQQLTARIAAVKCLPDWTGPLSETRLAAQMYGAIGLPDQRQYFSLGGSQLLRGFDLAERQGSLIWVGSLEWRVPLARGLCWDCCDHAAGLRNVYAAAFYDVGDAYLSGQSLGAVAHSLGAGLRLDVAWVSIIERTILRIDVAKVVNAETPVQIWFGVQHPF